MNTENKFAVLPVVQVGEITKACMFTDCHWGARNNSDQHNQDNLRYIQWFVEQVKREKPSHIFFLGDWFENRNQINVKTMDYSQQGARLLDSLGIPVIFIVGNHDLYLRSDRSIFSTNIFKDLKNFVIVDQPMHLNKVGDWLFSPYLFANEYPLMAAHVNSSKYVAGHFEFRNFVVTGSDRMMDHGPDASVFNAPEYIFSGHFHKRQANKNVIYIGNTFPTNYGDAGDSERGMCIFDVVNNDVSFLNWTEAPLFFKVYLSRIISESMDFPPDSRVRCILDMDIVYTEVQNLREEMVSLFKLREFSVEMDNNTRKNMLNDGLEIEADIDLASLDNTVRKMISEGVSQTANIDPALLIQLYDNLVSQ